MLGRNFELEMHQRAEKITNSSAKIQAQSGRRTGSRGGNLFAIKLNDEQFLEVVINGRRGTQMPAFGYRLTKYGKCILTSSRRITMNDRTIVNQRVFVTLHSPSGTSACARSQTCLVLPDLAQSGLSRSHL
jgi:hypothetical protein